MMDLAWRTEPRIEPFNWQTSASEWIENVHERFTEKTDYKGGSTKYDATTAPGISLGAVSSEHSVLDARLFVVPLRDGGVLVFVGGDDVDRDPEIEDAWLSAASAATEDLGENVRAFRYTAVIAGTPNTDGARGRLFEPVQVGPFHLESIDTPYRELSQDWSVAPPVGRSASVVETWPILATAVATASSWAAARVRAASDVSRLCALVSLVSGSVVVVRGDPVPANLDRGALAEDPWINWERFPEDLLVRSDPESLNVRDLPEAWEAVAKRPGIGDAVAAYHEGLLIRQGHPSLALIAFIAAIEGLADRHYKTVRCGDCRGHLHMAARFREMLRLVVSDAEADALGRAYTPRSKTVHLGQLHGADAYGRVGGLHMWGDDPATTFDYGIVTGVRHAAEKLLRQALRGEIAVRRRPLDLKALGQG